MSTIAFLKDLPVFKSMSKDGLLRLSDRCELAHFRQGELILRRGDAGDAMFVIRKGQVIAPIKDEQGNDRLLARLRDGDFFGEMALLTGEPRLADVIADSDVECLKIRKEPFEALLAENPAVASFLTAILGQRLLEGGNIRNVGKYRVMGELGAGGMARVFEGRHRTLGTTVAIKMLSHELVYDREFAARFESESRILAGLRHDGIVKVIDVEEAYATYFIIMEKVSGTDLHSMLRARGVVPIEDARSILIQLAQALDYAHSRGIIHRDVKPGNVIVEPSGQVKLMDFGIAKTRAEAAQESADVLGTPEYMSPEHSQGVALDGRTDVYSLGVLAYELLTGRPPFRAADSLEVFRMHEEDEPLAPKLLNPKIPADLEEMILVALRKRPEERFQTAGEVALLLGAARPTAIDVARARSRTMTFIYDGRHEEVLAAFLDRVREEAGKLPGVRIAVGGGAKVE